MIKNHIKGGMKVLLDYGAGLLLYFILLYSFIAITKDNFARWLPLYSFLMFMLIYVILYSDMWSLGDKERKPQYNIKTYPLKGLVMGLIGIFPIIVLVTVAHFLNFGDEILNNIKTAVVENFLIGPVYFITSIVGKSTIGYIISLLIFPIVSMSAYYLGLKQKRVFGDIKRRKNQEFERETTLSPWNPARTEKDDVKKTRKDRRI